MRKEVIRVGGIAVVLVAIFAVAVGLYRRSQRAEHERVVAEAKVDQSNSVFVRPHSHILGPANAKVTVVEFLDPECESCRAIYPMVKHLLQEYEGSVRLVVRYMPLHPNSVYAA